MGAAAGEAPGGGAAEDPPAHPPARARAAALGALGVGLALGSALGSPREALGRLAGGARWLARNVPRLPWRRRRPVRVYMDGCFDLAHYGHANALRQAAACGDELVVGICSDAEIERCKGPPVLNLEEREGVIRANKWVTEVISGTPYELEKEFIDRLFAEYKVDFIIHGDDPCLLPDGTDAYAAVKAAGRFKTIKRTEGVSTTDIVGRMLLSESGSIRAPAEAASTASGSRSRASSTSAPVAGSPAPAEAGVEAVSASPSSGPNSSGVAAKAPAPAEPKLYNFLPTSRRILQFSTGRVPSKNDRVVYLMGDWDMFNWGHVQLLKAARELGDFLVVGVLGDEAVKQRRGRHHPILNLQERTLSVLACKYVDEVIMGCPWEVSGDMLTTFNISVVVRVVPGESGSSGTVVTSASGDDEDPFALPEGRGLVREIVWSSSLSVADIIARVIANRAAFEAKYERKAKTEKEYVAGKAFVAEK